MTTGIYSYRGAHGTTMSVTIKAEPVLIKNLPPQGKGFFTVFSTMFRGRGVHLTSSREDNFGLYSVICDFFTAVSVAFIIPPSSPHREEAFEAAVLSQTVESLDIIGGGGDDLAKALLKIPAQKNPHKFRIITHVNTERDRDLIIHHCEADTTEHLRDFIQTVQFASNKLFIGGFYILITVPGYKSTDLLLSITASSLTPLTYVGMILANNIHSLWIFRLEKDKRDITSSRLTRYPIALQKVISELTPEYSEIATTDNGELDILVTPTATLNDLFRLLNPRSYREIFNMLINFQTKYTAVIERAKGNKDQKVQMKILVDLLYDLALSFKRSECLSSQPPQGIV